jgi:GATA-binding protein
MCAIRHLPVTDFKSVHAFGTMDAKRRSSSPQLRSEETYPLRNTLPLRDSSRENIEYPPRLQESSHERGRSQHENERSSSSPRFTSLNPPTGSPSFHRVQQDNAKSDSSERGQPDRASSYTPSIASQSDIPSGQVCR